MAVLTDERDQNVRTGFEYVAQAEPLRPDILFHANNVTEERWVKGTDEITRFTLPLRHLSLQARRCRYLPLQESVVLADAVIAICANAFGISCELTQAEGDRPVQAGQNGLVAPRVVVPEQSKY